MSADNYFVVYPHPSGEGFAVVQGFASDEGVRSPSLEDTMYPTIDEALNYAYGEYSEYGVVISYVLDRLKEKE